MNYKYLLFDLDGTLTQPKEGITKCVQYALASMGIDEPDLDKLIPFIGPPLKEMFMASYNMDEAAALRAVEKYRERFSTVGLYENGVYPGMKEALMVLKASGRKMAVATSKPTEFAEKILDKFGLSVYFDFIIGSELDGTRTDKQEVIEEVLRRFELKERDFSRVLMIGDRKYDIEGAKKLGIASLGVSFGYAAEGELEASGADYIVDTAARMAHLILSPIQKISIIGMGALGILLGDDIGGKIGMYQVTFIADSGRQERYRKEGIWFNGKRMPFRMATPEAAAFAELLIVAVKATGLAQAVGNMEKSVGKDTTIISLINGITSEEIIGQAYGMGKVIYCVAQGMDAVKTGMRLACTQRGQLCIGIQPDETEKEDRLKRLVDFFENIERPFTIEVDIKHRLWAKFMMNVGINQASMVCETNYGGVQKEGSARDLMIDAMKEVITLAPYENVSLGEWDLNFYLNLIDSLNPSGMPSMRQDALAKRPSEVELFAGAVVHMGKKYGVDTPVNQWIYEKVKAMEAAYTNTEVEQ